MAFEAVKDFFNLNPQDSRDDYEENGGYDDYDGYTESNGYAETEEYGYHEAEAESVGRNRGSFRNLFRGNNDRRENYREDENTDYSFRAYEDDRRTAGTTRVMLIKAKRFSEVKRIAENLKKKCSVIINFEGMEKDEAQRTIDFLSGCTFGFDGHIQKISHCTFIFAVGSVDLVGRIEEMKDAESYFTY